jgi:predicted ArsR family transcriptional regulator
LHASGVRAHLLRLHGAGLVSRERVMLATGRPRDAWSIAVDALPGSNPPGAYRILAGWLASSIPPTKPRLREVERTGRKLGAELGHGRGEGSSGRAMGRALTALGFAPQRARAEQDRTRFTLHNCPYREAVRANQPIVCALHRGLTRGLLDALEPTATLTGFVPHDPDRAGCLIEVQGLSGH